MEIDFCFDLVNALCGFFLGLGAWCFLLIYVQKSTMQDSTINFLANTGGGFGIATGVYVIAYLVMSDMSAMGLFIFFLMNISALVAGIFVKVCCKTNKKSGRQKLASSQTLENLTWCTVWYVVVAVFMAIALAMFCFTSVVFYKSDGKLKAYEFVSRTKCTIINNVYHVVLEEKDSYQVIPTARVDCDELDKEITKISKLNGKASFEQKKKARDLLLKVIDKSQGSIKSCSKEEMKEVLK